MSFIGLTPGGSVEKALYAFTVTCRHSLSWYGMVIDIALDCDNANDNDDKDSNKRFKIEFCLEKNCFRRFLGYFSSSFSL